MTYQRHIALQRNAEDGRSHAVVIGSGFGGLAAAVRLGARGYRVTVLERLDQPGGRARRFRQDGFTFDAGPTIITAPFVLEELWKLCGKTLADDVQLVALDPFYAVRFDDGSEFRPSADETRIRAEVSRLSPGDVAGYERYLEESARCFEAGFTGMVDRPIGSLAAMAAVLPDLIRRRADRSVFNLVGRHIKDPRLRVALSFHPLFIGGNPLRTSAMMSLISYLEKQYGVHYAMGGTHALVEGLCNLIDGQGGQVICNAEVARIDEDKGRASGVTLSDDTTIPASIVVSNADTGWTYKNLLKTQRAKRWTAAKIDRAKHSMSLFVWYFGTNRTYPNIDHHTVVMGPRFKGLLTDIFDRRVLAEDFSLYLYRPTATDPSMAPDGCDSFYVLSPVPNLEAEFTWTSDLVERYRQRIEAYLAKEMLPDLGHHVVTSKLMTPVDFKNELLSIKGAAFGMEPLLTQLAWFRPHNKSEELENLYIVGAGTHPGAGLPGVISSAKILDSVVPHARQNA
ncbi:phytoene desaturase [Roseibium hamelinense]|uniref:Phytoene dehydrogenase n=1 Tax=Roseibium hamelinense TaxID=150831 RepID=A0A562SXJ1_9HYPH|nr:phytoene desaturase [Roseibium hamelinense]MTI44835.1 phytoene desaturase [Roseibium hamelinense]TWI85972.1 phytoene desaturase [Roseibium hamelinense]